MKLEFEKVRPLIISALDEDIGPGDITTLSCIPEDKTAKAVIISKDNGIICGLDIISFIFKFKKINGNIKFNFNDGDHIQKGDVIVELDANAQSILSVERTILNFIQNLSGVSTITNNYIKKLAETQTKLLDTRKTTPGLRYLQKYAIKMGGGSNHRMGLYDMILIKDNHIKVTGSITNTVSKARKRYQHKYKIEVECSTINEVNEALQTDCDWIMLDNMNNNEMEKAISIINKKKKVEASGGITIENLNEIANLGVDYISVGALTHSYKALDLSMKISILN